MRDDSLLQKQNRRLTRWLLLGVVFMFGFCYMLVPLYRLVCKREGINGQSVRSAAVVSPDMQVDNSRVIHVTLMTTINGRLGFDFRPLQQSVDIHPGERKLIYFYAANHAGKDITVQAIPSITPADAARFLKKTECFCFTQQFFLKNERADMPVYFFVEPEIPRNVHDITLSYTLFDATEYVREKTPARQPGRINL